MFSHHLHTHFVHATHTERLRLRRRLRWGALTWLPGAAMRAGSGPAAGRW